MIKTISSSLLLLAVAVSSSYADSNGDEEVQGYKSTTKPALVSNATDSTVTDQTDSMAAAGTEHKSHSYELVDVNPADPAFWARAVHPVTHPSVHMTMTNPAQHQKMMTPQFYMNMMNPSIWAKWMNPESYATFMSPGTWMGWMNPEAYTHAFNPAAYEQMMNPSAYGKMMDPATYSDYISPTMFTEFTAMFDQAEGTEKAAENNTRGGSFFDWFKMASIPSVPVEAAQ